MHRGRHPVLDRLQTRKERHALRGRLYRVAFAAAGFAVLAAGLAMLVLPGPGLLVIAIGLAMLALEFAWAERALGHTVDRMGRAGRAAREASRSQKAAGSIAVVLAALAVVVAAQAWDVPLLPF